MNNDNSENYYGEVSTYCFELRMKNLYLKELKQALEDHRISKQEHNFLSQEKHKNFRFLQNEVIGILKQNPEAIKPFVLSIE